MTCFVTVGSTQFDALIEAVCSKEAVDALRKRGITQVILQTGTGTFRPADCEWRQDVAFVNGMPLHFYSFKNDISGDMRRAKIIIAHAGAGTCMEALRCSKVVFAVVNEELMDNHQRELGERLAELGHLVCTTPTQLISALETVDVSRLKPFVLRDVMATAVNTNRTSGVSSGH
uniref:UDP-N-acetylglucosamine transferase subunit ALG13 n=2 Tax=Parascaris TaxID=6254 RepID=A0A914SAS0_PAREQ